MRQLLTVVCVVALCAASGQTVEQPQITHHLTLGSLNYLPCIMLNGQTFTEIELLKGAEPEILAKAGGVLKGRVRVRVDWDSPHAYKIPTGFAVGAMNTLGDREIVELAPAIVPGRPHLLTYNVNSRAPDKPGTYYIGIACGYFRTVEELILLRDRRYKGEDTSMFTWSEEQWEQAIKTGIVDSTRDGRPSEAWAIAVRVVVHDED